jgi:hypothetical protein
MWRASLASVLFLCAGGAWSQPAYTVEKVSYADYLSPGKLTIVASFDGSKALDRWQDILSFARDKGVKFTFFISSVYFVPDAGKQVYIYPVDPSRAGVSDIGFGGSADDVVRRIAFVREAAAEGHDIQSHLNGHFDGSRWTEAMWRQEFREFNDLCPFLPAKAAHVRFPLLAMNGNAFPAMAENGIRSVTSVYGTDFHLFHRVTLDHGGSPYTLVEFPISFEHENGATVILMDYNFYLYDQKYHIDPLQAEADMVALYLDEARKCFAQKRPLFISHHFSNWNHAAYWTAMKSVIDTLEHEFPVEYLTISDLYEKVSY